MAGTVKIALVSRTVFYAPVWTAEQNGYFKDEGVDPHFEIFDNAEKINEVMHSGEAQIAIASVEALVADSFKGGKFRIVASVAQKPPHFIIARPHIKTVTDLKGARFGVLSLHEGTTYFVQDIEKALKWYRASEQQGWPEAEVNLGRMYDEGQGVGQNPLAALGSWGRVTLNQWMWRPT